jgi:hypothetical protein
MSYEIFLSHSNDADGQLVERIKAFFNDRLILMYSYKHETGGYGESLEVTIEDTIKDCTYVFFLITNQALNSPWVAREIAATERHGKIPIALMWRGLGVGQLPEYLRERKAIVYSTEEDVIRQLSEMDWGMNVYIPGGGFGGSKIEFSPDFPPKMLYPIGDKPILFHIINALNSDAFKQVIVMNKTSRFPEFIEYLTKLAFPKTVVCRETQSEHWPQALVENKPTATFLLQLCDVILWLPGDKSETDLKRDWDRVVVQHKQALEFDPNYLGTLLVSSHYKIPAGKVVLGTGGAIATVEENPLTEHIMMAGSFINTGTAILEPALVDYIEPGDEAILDKAIERARKDRKRFGTYLWDTWYHILNTNDWHNLHREYLRFLRRAKASSDAATAIT